MIETISEARPAPRQFALQVVERVGIWVVLLGLIALASGLSPYFLTSNNLLNVLNQASVVGVTAIGVTLVMITGGVDLSVGSVISFSAALTATIMAGQDGNILLACAAGAGAGAVVGMVNGLLVAKRNVPSFILTLGTAAAVQGINLVYTGGTASGIVSPWFYEHMGGRPIAGVPTVVWILAAVILLGLIVEKTTSFGRYLFLVGSNVRAAALSGAPVDRVLVLAYTLSGLGAGIAGIVLLARVGVSSAFAGQGYEFDALAAVVLGGTTFEGGRGGIVGTVAGILILAISFNLVNILGLNFNAQMIVKGAIIIGAAALYRLIQRRT